MTNLPEWGQRTVAQIALPPSFQAVAVPTTPSTRHTARATDDVLWTSSRRQPQSHTDDNIVFQVQKKKTAVYSVVTSSCRSNGERCLRHTESCTVPGRETSPADDDRGVHHIYRTSLCGTSGAGMGVRPVHTLHSQYKCAPRALTSQPVQVCVPCTHFTASTSVCPVHSLHSQYKCVSRALTSQLVEVCAPCTHFTANTSVPPMHSLHSQYKCAPHALTSQPIQVCPPCTHFTANQPAGKTRQTLTHCQLPNVADMQQEITRL